MSEQLFSPVTLGSIALKNRIVMAPMTRSRASAGDMPNALMKTYYQQRASAGLIISEGTHPSIDGKGYCRTPGIYNQQQVEAWREITQAVHEKGGKMVLQLMHCGRIGHSANKAANAKTIAPSAIAAKGEIYTEQGMQAFDKPLALSLEGIEQVINDYKTATANAYAAGFDGVELHCASGYLPAQFLSTGTNTRTDAYGGSLNNRLRFVIEVLEAMSDIDGPERVGFRIAPANPFNDLYDENPIDTFSALLKALSHKGLAYLHAIQMPDVAIDVIALAKENFNGPLIINQDYTQQRAEKVLADNNAAAVSFGRPFIANPNLADVFKQGLALKPFNPKTLYSDGPEGYIDY